MTSAEFHAHLGRLTEQFGKAAYSQARAELIWREVRDFSPHWWEKTVDKFLLSSRQAPLMTELAEEIGAERERLYKREKEQHKKDVKDFFKGIYQPEDIKTIVQYSIKRMQRQVSDEDFENFLKHLTETANAVPQSGVSCKTCEDSGIVIDKDNCLCRCHCNRGRQRAENFPAWRAP